MGKKSAVAVFAFVLVPLAVFALTTSVYADGISTTPVWTYTATEVSPAGYAGTGTTQATKPFPDGPIVFDTANGAISNAQDHITGTFDKTSGVFSWTWNAYNVIGGSLTNNTEFYDTFAWTLAGTITSSPSGSLLSFNDPTITVQAPIYSVPVGCSGSLSCLIPLGYSLPVQLSFSNQSMTVGTQLLQPVPEPSSLLLVSTGLSLGIAVGASKLLRRS